MFKFSTILEFLWVGIKETKFPGETGHKNGGRFIGGIYDDGGLRGFNEAGEWEYINSFWQLLALFLV